MFDVDEVSINNLFEGRVKEVLFLIRERVKEIESILLEFDRCDLSDECVQKIKSLLEERTKEAKHLFEELVSDVCQFINNRKQKHEMNKEREEKMNKKSVNKIEPSE